MPPGKIATRPPGTSLRRTCCWEDFTSAKASFRTSGRRAGQRFDAENGVTTEALIFLNTLDPEYIGPNLEFATHYEPTPVREINALLDSVPGPLDETTFIDIGSGMGRVVLLAALRPFKTIVGVEISPTLHEVARENLEQFRDREEATCRDIRLIRADAAEYRFPRGKLAVYMYNPFRAPVVRRMLDRLLSVPREITLIYHTPLERAVIDSSGAFQLIQELPSALIYRSYCGA